MRFVLSEASERLTSMKTNNCHLDLTMKKMYGKITHSLGWSLGLGSGVSNDSVQGPDKCWGLWISQCEYKQCCYKKLMLKVGKEMQLNVSMF